VNFNRISTEFQSNHSEVNDICRFPDHIICLLTLGFKRLPAKTTQFGKQLAVIKEITPQNLGNAENHMPVRDRLNHLPAQPFAKFYNPLLMTRGAEMPPFARKSEQILMPTVTAPHTGKAIMQNPAVQVTQNYLPNIRSIKTILPFEPIFFDKKHTLFLNSVNLKNKFFTLRASLIRPFAAL